MRVVGLVKPRYFVMENVPNLLTAEGGYFRKEIEELFNSMGYQLKMGVLNASGLWCSTKQAEGGHYR